MKNSELVQTALDCGLTKAVVIGTDQIDLNIEYRKICERNQCGGYGRCWMCPPSIGDVEENMKTVRSFKNALLYQTIGELEDSLDIEGMHEVKTVHSKNSQKLRVAVENKLGRAIFLGVGGCGLCEKCAKQDDQPCRFPDKAMPALEGYGIGVYNTTKDTPLKYINGQDTVTYFGLVLFDGEDDE